MKVVAIAASLFLMTAGAIDGSAQEAEKLFLERCANCHGPDAKAQSARAKKMGLRDLTAADVQKQSDAQLAEIIVKGKGAMPAFAKDIDERQTKLMVEYLRAVAKGRK
jgi:mono/diheme cytochrome c family protein